MSLEIQLDQEKYKSGDVISGSILIKNDIPIEVTGLKITMFTYSKFEISTESDKTTKWTQPVKMETLDSILLDGSKKQRTLAPGTHPIPFHFSALSNIFSFEEGNQFCRYYLKAELDISHKGSVSVKKDLKILPLPLNDNPNATGWQTQSLEKGSLNLKITLPTGIGRQENVPIDISTSSKNLSIRSRLIRIYRLPMDFNEQAMEFKETENSEELDPTGIHFLKIDDPRSSHDGPLTSNSYRIEIEVQNSNGKLLMLEFPVIVGDWKYGVVEREQIA